MARPTYGFGNSLALVIDTDGKRLIVAPAHASARRLGVIGILFHLCRMHAFIDGNKRVGLMRRLPSADESIRSPPGNHAPLRSRLCF